MQSRVIAFVALFLSFSLPLQTNAEIVKIGVLSSQGFHSSMKQWQDTADYLTAKIPEHVFQILPYSRYPDLETDMNKNKLDFLLAAKHELPRFVADFSVMPVMNSKVVNNTEGWALVRKRQLPYQLTFSVSDALLNLPARHKALQHSGLSSWQLSGDAHIAISSNQKLKKLYNASTELVIAVLKQYWSFILAAMVSGLLILLYRKWDLYHTRQSKIKAHREQSNDPSLSDTVF